MLLFVAAPISIGPASLTYPELAQALTKAGMPTQAAPTLASRAAFVRLKARTPERTRTLLAQALGVAFRAEANGWRMVPDPNVVERDRAFLALYRRQAVEKAREWATAQDALRAGRDYAKLDADVRFASKAYENAALPPDAVTRAGLRRLFAFSVLMNPAAWIGGQAFRDADAVARSISGPVSTTTPVGRVESVYSLPPTSLGVPAPSFLSTTLVYDPVTGVLSDAASAMIGPDGETRDLAPYPFTARIGPYVTHGTGGKAETRVEGTTLVETFNRMGQAAGDYLRGFGSPPVLPTSPVAAGPMPPTLSSVLERLDVEAAMELSPRFESLPRREMPATLSPRDLFAVPPYPSAPSGAVPAWLLDLTRLEDRTSVVARSRGFPWRVRLQDGVYLVENPVAFLDRAQPFSPVPALRVERVLAEVPADAPTDLAGMPLPDWSRLESLVAAVGTGSGLLTGYRGIDLGGLATLFPFVRLLSRVPEADRAAFWRDAAQPSGGKATVGGGTLSLQSSLWGAEYGYKKPVLHVVGRWSGPGGPLYGEANLDPRGTIVVP